MIGYGRCECDVWPIVHCNPVGRCGRCSGKVKMYPVSVDTRDAGAVLFEQEMGKPAHFKQRENDVV